MLRALLRIGDDEVVAHTMALSEHGAVVQADYLAEVGEVVDLELSFPGLVEPLHIRSQISATHLPAGAGNPGGWELSLAGMTDEQEDALRRLLARVDSSPAQTPKSPYRILLVEDSALTREAFSVGAQMHLGSTSAAVEVKCAADVDEAWSMLQADPCDLAIVDYILPASNGDALIARIRDSEALSGLPVLAMSMGGTEAREASLSAGADFFLHKPLLLQDLFSTLYRLTSTRSAS
jgi:CheY-like chemotaxis protein